MANKIPEYEAKSFADFIAAVEKAKTSLGARELWFRGVSKANHKLIPSLFRHPTKATIEEIALLEGEIYQEFTFRSPSYDAVKRDDWDRLFLMQHYRSPTRLLDWTSSPLVALFFAVSHATDDDTDAVVWVMDPAAWNAGILNDISQEPVVFSTSEDILEPYHPKNKTKGRSQPLAMEGIINNTRINAQKGKFVIFGHQLKSQEDHAQECAVWSESIPLHKIVCRSVAIPKIAADLNDYGITHTSIYPDLEGLAVEIKIRAGYPHV